MKFDALGGLKKRRSVQLNILYMSKTSRHISFYERRHSILLLSIDFLLLAHIHLLVSCSVFRIGQLHSRVHSSVIEVCTLILTDQTHVHYFFFNRRMIYNDIKEDHRSVFISLSLIIILDPLHICTYKKILLFTKLCSLMF